MSPARPNTRRLFLTWLIAATIGAAAGFAASAFWDYLTNDSGGSFSPQIVMTTSST